MTEQRPVGTMGLFFSAFGYTAPAFELVDRLRPIRVLLIDRRDLDWAIPLPASMMEMVRRKWVIAVMTGQSYLPVTRYPAVFGGLPSHAAH